MKFVNVIGAGLAGSEAAYQLAKRGIQVKLYEMRPVKKYTCASHTKLRRVSLFKFTSCRWVSKRCWGIKRRDAYFRFINHEGSRCECGSCRWSISS